jgi:hypothetical protein
VNGVVHTIWVRREPRAPTRGRDPFE